MLGQEEWAMQEQNLIFAVFMSIFQQGFVVCFCNFVTVPAISGILENETDTNHIDSDADDSQSFGTD